MTELERKRNLEKCPQPVVDFEPTLDRIVVHRDKAPEKIGKIIVPDKAQLKTTEATVIKTGPGRLDDEYRRVPMVYKPGDRIIIDRYAGTEVELEVEGNQKHKFVFMTEDEVYAILR